MKKKTQLLIFPLILMGMLLMLTNSCNKDEEKDDPAQGNTVTDIDGNVYHTVTIGTQVWMLENLKVTKYNDGTAIPLVTDGTAWTDLTTAGFCWYDNDEATYKNAYGALYNFYAVNTGKLSPTGWHVPSDAELTTLTSYLGGESVAGGKLKEVGTTHWQSPNTGATNESGFTILPAGYRYMSSFTTNGKNGFLWSTTEESGDYAWVRNIGYDRIDVSRYGGYKGTGWSVRCVKD